MGGMIAQVIAQDEPALVRKLILTGTGPDGCKGIKDVVWVAQLDTLRGLLSRQDPKQFLFFTRTANGKREGKAFLARLQERTSDRDTPTTISSYFAQLKACRRWGKEEPHDLSHIRQPVLLAKATTTGVAHAEHPRHGPTSAEQPVGDPPGRRPRRNLPVPRAVRRQGTPVPRELGRVSKSVGGGYPLRRAGRPLRGDHPISPPSISGGDRRRPRP
jgi:pimeloyl-ACP methyl ester carboxylesterase